MSGWEDSTQPPPQLELGSPSPPRTHHTAPRPLQTQPDPTPSGAVTGPTRVKSFTSPSKRELAAKGARAVGRIEWGPSRYGHYPILTQHTWCVGWGGVGGWVMGMGAHGAPQPPHCAARLSQDC